MTNATSWPWKRTLSVARTAWRSADIVGIHAMPRASRSRPVTTAWTFGRASAAVVSIESMRACASGLRRIAPWSVPGRRMSSRNVPCPRIKRASSLRRRRPKPIGRSSAPAAVPARWSVLATRPLDPPEALLLLAPRVAGRRLVGDRDVHRLADRALHADLLRHVVRVHPGHEDVAALDADIVVRAVAAPDGAAGRLLERGAAVLGHLALADPPHLDAGHRAPQMDRSRWVKSLISPSSTDTTMPSPIDAALPVICAAVWILPPPSARSNATSAFAWPWPPTSRDLTFSSAWRAASSCATTSTVPANVIDIAPIFPLISAFAAVGLVRSTTRPPWTHGTSRSRSRIASQL